jgi:hypothetical protein
MLLFKQHYSIDYGGVSAFDLSTCISTGFTSSTRHLAISRAANPTDTRMREYIELEDLDLSQAFSINILAMRVTTSRMHMHLVFA